MLSVPGERRLLAKTEPVAGVAKSAPKQSRSKAVAAEADGTHLTKGQLNAACEGQA